jgi:hypothetical protein
MRFDWRRLPAALSRHVSHERHQHGGMRRFSGSAHRCVPGAPDASFSKLHVYPRFREGCGGGLRSVREGVQEVRQNHRVQGMRRRVQGMRRRLPGHDGLNDSPDAMARAGRRRATAPLRARGTATTNGVTARRRAGPEAIMASFRPCRAQAVHAPHGGSYRLTGPRSRRQSGRLACSS